MSLTYLIDGANGYAGELVAAETPHQQSDHPVPAPPKPPLKPPKPRMPKRPSAADELAF